MPFKACIIYTVIEVRLGHVSLCRLSICSTYARKTLIHNCNFDHHFYIRMVTVIGLMVESWGWAVLLQILYVGEL